jgi:hypothetical protein
MVETIKLSRAAVKVIDRRNELANAANARWRASPTPRTIREFLWHQGRFTHALTLIDDLSAHADHPTVQ